MMDTYDNILVRVSYSCYRQVSPYLYAVNLFNFEYVSFNKVFFRFKLPNSVVKPLRRHLKHYDITFIIQHLTRYCVFNTAWTISGVTSPLCAIYVVSQQKVVWTKKKKNIGKKSKTISVKPILVVERPRDWYLINRIYVRVCALN